MAAHGTGNAAREIGRIFDGGSLAGLDDAEVLRRFARGDEAAFEAVLARLGPMVLATCRRALRDEQDAEDAFQATFLVLLRRAGSLRRPERLGPWLHGVACRVASRIRAQAARRRQDEPRAARPEGLAGSPALGIESAELRSAIDEEISRLPERDRRAVVLCLLEGRSHEETARRLRCTVGSVRGRLDKARRTLKGRLIRRGVAPAAAATSLSAAGEANAAVPAPLLGGTVAMLAKAATAEAVSAAIAPGILEASRGVVRGMIAARLTAAAAIVLGLGVLAMAAAPLVVAIEPTPPRQDGSSKASDRRNVTVTGRVVDDEGNPVAGAAVAAGTDFREKEPDAEAVTDAEGRFALKGLKAGPVVLTVQGKGHAPDLLATTAAPGMKPVEFELKAAHAIRGRIVDADDKPIAGAPIAADEWRGHHTLRWHARTDAEGRYRWDDAPADMVLIDLGSLGYSGKRYWQAAPDAPEKTIPMRRPFRVRGRVTDAETGRPILAYSLVPGYAGPGPGDHDWANDRVREVRGSSFELDLSTERPNPVVRVEARGYAPAVSRRLDDPSSEAVVDFPLRKRAWIGGEVRLPDGPPAADVRVLAFGRGFVSIVDGRPMMESGPYRIAATGPDGTFGLPPMEPPYTVLALHARGLAWHRQEAAGGAPSATTLKLQPWGRVEGRLRLGGRPAPGQLIRISRADAQDRPAGAWWGDGTQTDPDGRFAFDRVVPGDVRLSRQVEVEAGKGIYSEVTPALVAAVRSGETTEVTLGGTGRPVVGKVQPPPGLARSGGWRHALGFVSPRPGAAAAPSRPGTGGAFPVEADGSFSIEGLAPGTYDVLLQVTPEPPDASRGPFGQVPLAMIRREVVIPDHPTGPDAPPLDLGTITPERVESQGAR
ncbi:ECF RNA polymerase sigma-E factor [Aquisphaera giovannonii]|uniref:ECF RNA polymerase sigma-E factor n=1 Tax=Aquisphaera giovannonii TaxID=406548 RepID=A0A5B9VV04_9BACT|nr:sigma-70 family RNA polymerase sigma factor [Aquisphaera giovannonii]QEH31949.1 ECF RNA polymerase sigma-E factor [Aquisphaera giovannonii]